MAVLGRVPAAFAAALRTLRYSDKGVTAVEYGVLVALLGVAMLGAVAGLYSAATASYNRSEGEVGNLGTSCVGDEVIDPVSGLCSDNPLSISGVTPAYGPPAGGTTVTITVIFTKSGFTPGREPRRHLRREPGDPDLVDALRRWRVDRRDLPLGNPRAGGRGRQQSGHDRDDRHGLQCLHLRDDPGCARDACRDRRRRVGDAHLGRTLRLRRSPADRLRGPVPGECRGVDGIPRCGWRDLDDDRHRSHERNALRVPGAGRECGRVRDRGLNASLPVTPAPTGPVGPTAPTAPTITGITGGNKLLTVNVQRAFQRWRRRRSPTTSTRRMVRPGPRSALLDTSSPLVITGLADSTTYTVANPSRERYPHRCGVLSPQWAPRLPPPDDSPFCTAGPNGGARGRRGGRELGGARRRRQPKSTCTTSSTRQARRVLGPASATRLARSLCSGRFTDERDALLLPGCRPQRQRMERLLTELRSGYAGGCTGRAVDHRDHDSCSEAAERRRSRLRGPTVVPRSRRTSTPPMVGPRGRPVRQRSTASPILITQTSAAGATALADGTSYNVQIRAVNVINPGPASTTVVGTTIGVPGAPSITGITTPAAKQLSVAFTPPGSDGGSAITTYQYSTDGGSTWKTRTTGSTASPILITQTSAAGATALADGTSYNVQIRAVNVIGPGPASATTVGVTLCGTPDAPSGLKGVFYDQRMYLSWTAPAGAGGCAIDRYQVQYSTNGTTWTDWTQLTSAAPTYKNGSNLGTAATTTVRVSARNAAGNWSSSLDDRTNWGMSATISFAYGGSCIALNYRDSRPQWQLADSADDWTTSLAPAARMRAFETLTSRQVGERAP